MNRLARHTLALVLLASPPALAQELVDAIPTPVPQSGFGNRVVLDGPDQLLVASSFQMVGNASGAGALHIFRRQAGAWVLDGSVSASDAMPDDRMGTAIDVLGDLALAVNWNQGLYVFERSALGWAEVDRVWPPAATNGSDPNRVVALAGESLLLGIYKTNTFSGVTFCFDRTLTGWVEVQGPEPVGGVIPSSRFGAALDWDETTGRLAVGAIGNGNAAVYIFERQGSTWVQVGRIPSPTLNGFFGWAVDLDGDTIAIGAPYRNITVSQAGAVHVYRRTGPSTWQADSGTLFASDRLQNGHFGTDLELDGDRLLVGAPGAGPGGVYVFHRGINGWEQTGKLLSPVPNPAANTGFGLTLALEQDTLMVGPKGTLAESVLVYDLPSEVTPYGFCADSAPCSNPDAFGGCANSTGSGGHLTSTGSVSVITDNLQLTAESLPANVTGLMFMGGAQTSAPLGDGFLLVAPGSAGLYRFQPQSTGATGSLILGPGIAALTANMPAGAQIVAGSTWFFQSYYRDPSGPCSAQSNLTNGLKIEFLP